MKSWYDRKSKKRVFCLGDKVLLLLPIQGQPLSAKYSGPYVVDKKLSDLNYVVNTPMGRKAQQLCHINMIGRRRSPAVACWASDHWVASSNPLTGKFRH